MLPGTASGNQESGGQGASHRGSLFLPNPFDPAFPSSSRGGCDGNRLIQRNQRYRRARILAETRRLLAEDTLKNFNVQRVSEQSDVTVQTIYNNFGSRHELLSSAVNEHTMLMDRSAQKSSASAITFLNLGKLYYQCAIATPSFLREMVTAAFSPKWPMMDALQAYSTKHKAGLLRSMENGELLKSFVDPGALAHQITRVNTICVYGWSYHGDSLELFKQLSSGIGLLLLGALRPPFTGEVEKWLDCNDYCRVSHRDVQ